MQSTLDELTKSMDECGSFLAREGAPGEAVFAANLAMEELITNTIKYGGSPESHGPIHLRLQLFPKKFLLHMEDSASEFDPFSQEPPDLSLPIDQRPIGGLGLHLVKSLMSACHYRRDGGRNHVVLEKVWD